MKGKARGVEAAKTRPSAKQMLAGRFFFSSRRRHTRSYGDWSSDVCSSDLLGGVGSPGLLQELAGGVRQRGRAHLRSEERRVGKECRSGWWTERERKEAEDGVGAEVVAA